MLYQNLFDPRGRTGQKYQYSFNYYWQCRFMQKYKLCEMKALDKESMFWQEQAGKMITLEFCFHARDVII